MKNLEYLNLGFFCSAKNNITNNLLKKLTRLIYLILNYNNNITNDDIKPLVNLEYQV